MLYSPELIARWQGRRLIGKSAVVTGAGRGIGKAVALMFAAQGAQTLASDIDAQSLDRLRADARAADLEVSAVAADLTTEAGAALVAEAAGSVQILVNAAAITAFAPLESMTFGG